MEYFFKFFVLGILNNIISLLILLKQVEWYQTYRIEIVNLSIYKTLLLTFTRIQLFKLWQKKA